MIPCSSHVKCHARDVPCVFHGILHVKVHVHTLRETWSTQTRDVNLECLCRVSLRVHACKSEVINERYCTVPLNYNFTFTRVSMRGAMRGSRGKCQKLPWKASFPCDGPWLFHTKTHGISRHVAFP